MLCLQICVRGVALKMRTSFFVFWAVVFVITTTCLIIKQEEKDEEEVDGVMETYRHEV